jgi:hypothetical protein
MDYRPTVSLSPIHVSSQLSRSYRSPLLRRFDRNGKEGRVFHLVLASNKATADTLPCIAMVSHVSSLVVRYVNADAQNDFGLGSIVLGGIIIFVAPFIWQRE